MAFLIRSRMLNGQIPAWVFIFCSLKCRCWIIVWEQLWSLSFASNEHAPKTCFMGRHISSPLRTMNSLFTLIMIACTRPDFFFFFSFVISRFICLLLQYCWFSTVLVSLNYHMIYLQHAAVPWFHVMGEGKKNVSFKSGLFLKCIFLQEACLVCFCFARMCVFRESPPLPE